MFEVINIDSSDIAKNYGTSYSILQQEQPKIIPFIKKTNGIIIMLTAKFGKR
ncbi:MAG: hypothetical protein LH615_09875 [Ferruginibacter sp.]|nr:hypothetical protein [Ferruginibacter sp.]